MSDALTARSTSLDKKSYKEQRIKLIIIEI